jgi:hypothetical protein
LPNTITGSSKYTQALESITEDNQDRAHMAGRTHRLGPATCQQEEIRVASDPGRPWLHCREKLEDELEIPKWSQGYNGIILARPRTVSPPREAPWCFLYRTTPTIVNVTIICTAF